MSENIKKLSYLWKPYTIVRVLNLNLSLKGLTDHFNAISSGMTVISHFHPSETYGGNQKSGNFIK